MKKNNWKVTFIKFLSLISMAVLSLITCVIGTYSWFASNGVVEGDGMGMVIKNSEIIDHVTFHKYNPNYESTGNTLYFDTADSSDHSLGFYSLTGKHHQTLLEVQLKRDFDINVYSITRATFYLGNVYKIDGTTYNQLQLENNSLTSIVDFYVFNPNDVNYEADNINLNLKDSVSGKQTFINSDYTDLIDTNRLSMASLSGVTSVFILIDYDVFSIETIYSSNLGNDVLYAESQTRDEDNNSCITFDIDFNFEITALNY